MAFQVPEFPIECDIFTGPPPLGAARLTGVECNLAVGRRTQQDGVARGSDGAIGLAPTLLLPTGTDIRDLTSNTGSDYVEVPSGSGRIYQVSCEEEVARGFANQYRAAALTKASSNIDGAAWPGIVWPTPDT